MEITKIVGGLCGALLVFLLLQWGAEIIIHPGGHGDHHKEHAFVIEVEEEASSEVEEEVVEVNIEELLASADVASGEKLFKACKACHKVEDGANATGPYLYGVFGRDIASVDGFAFSDALLEAEGDWTAQALSAFIQNPKAFADGTKMKYKGMKKPADRADLIAYLDSLDD